MGFSGAAGPPRNCFPIAPEQRRPGLFTPQAHESGSLSASCSASAIVTTAVPYRRVRHLRRRVPFRAAASVSKNSSDRRASQRESGNLPASLS
jgi:hypothetical protein